MHSKDGANVLAATSSVPISVILRTVWNDMGDIFVRLRGQSATALSIVVVLDADSRAILCMEIGRGSRAAKPERVRPDESSGEKPFSEKELIAQLSKG